MTDPVRIIAANHRHPLVFSIIRDAVICVGITMLTVAVLS